MAAMAGAVGIVLEKPGHYVLNSEGRAPDAADIRRAISLCRRAAVLCGGIAAALILSEKSA
jgi:adenosylcobinamide-phosphate synthase